ncbi:MAG: 4'-phosphopantetheinyl transferase superfamily protein [Candidatus Eisenbacteria sp.]|nr:4'-phosphopantetheinyl transferase superfamily protein [Candidatus Eisenbacteria bacterium]
MEVERLKIDHSGRIAAPAASAAFPPGQAKIWSVRLDSVAPRWAATLLSDEERRRVEGIALPERGRRYAAAHAGVRVVLAACAGLRADRVIFEQGRHGKPRLVGQPGLRFSLSHSGAWGLIGVSTAGEIGVDIERVRSDLDPERLARRVFSSQELTVWDALATHGSGAAAPGSAAAEEHRRQIFLHAWVRKEAYAKARGEGLARGLRSFSVTIGWAECRQTEAAGDDKQAPRLIADERDPQAAEQWILRDLDIAAGYAGAVAFERRESRRGGIEG